MTQLGRSPLAEFLSRPWFKRRWIIQEIVLAREVFVHCGDMHLPWEMFELAVAELFENGLDWISNEHLATLRTMSRIRNTSAEAKSQSRLDILIEFSDFDCQNPKDRLYALYGVMRHLFPDPNNPALTSTVNYALTTKEIFTDFAIRTMGLQRQGVPRDYYDTQSYVLQLAAAFSRKPIAKGTDRLPSWVPDWAGTLSYEPIRVEHNQGSFYVHHRMMKHLQLDSRPPVLLHTGVVYDTVLTMIPFRIDSLLGDIGKAKRTFNEFLCSVVNTMDEVGFRYGRDNNTYDHNGEHIITAIATAPAADWMLTLNHSFFAQDGNYRESFLHQLSASNFFLPNILHKWPAFIEIVRITMRGRCLFLTQSGYIGVGSPSIEAGDMVCVLSGSPVNFILRPQNGTMAEKGELFLEIRGCLAASFYEGAANERVLEDVISLIRNNSEVYPTFQLISDCYTYGLTNRTPMAHREVLTIFAID